MGSLSTLAYSAPENNSAGERERLILEHLPQVRWIASRIHEKLPGSTSLEDLVSIGIVGLINAIDNFDPKFNVKLKTYAEHGVAEQSWIHHGDGSGRRQLPVAPESRAVNRDGVGVPFHSHWI